MVEVVGFCFCFCFFVHSSFAPSCVFSVYPPPPPLLQPLSLTCTFPPQTLGKLKCYGEYWSSLATLKSERENKFVCLFVCLFVVVVVVVVVLVGGVSLLLSFFFLCVCVCVGGGGGGGGWRGNIKRNYLLKPLVNSSARYDDKAFTDEQNVIDFSDVNHSVNEIWILAIKHFPTRIKYEPQAF